MTVGHKDPAPFQFNEPLVGRICKEIIVARNCIEGDFREFPIYKLASLEVSCMQNSVIFFFRRKNLEKNIVLRVCIS